MSTTITTYLTADDVNAAIASSELIQLLDDPVYPMGTLNTTLRDQLLTRVQGMMDSKIGVKNALPLVVDDTDAASVTETLRGCGLALFRWMAMRDKPHMEEAFKGVKDAYDDALRWLDDVAAGKAFLGTSRILPGAEARNAAVLSSEHKGRFSRERLKEW